MDDVSETEPPTTDGAAVAPPPTPGERRLAHPPSDRYREAEASSEETTADVVGGSGASVARGFVLAIVAGIAGAVAIVLLGGVLAISAGLVVVAAATGWVVGAAVRFGAGELLARRRRVVLAVAIALVAIVFAQIGLWQYALREGGVLPLVDYLGEVYGPLVPFEALAAVVVAWIAAR
jgi:hypothetical protein